MALASKDTSCICAYRSHVAISQIISIRRSLRPRDSRLIKHSHQPRTDVTKLTTNPKMVLQIANQPELNEAHYALFSSDAFAGSWILLNYVGRETLKMTAAGEDSSEGLVRELRDDEVQYALIRIDVSAADGKKELRDVLVTWTGPAVPIIEKGRKSQYQDAVAAQLPDHKASVHADDLKRITLEK